MPITSIKEVVYFCRVDGSVVDSEVTEVAVVRLAIVLVVDIRSRDDVLSTLIVRRTNVRVDTVVFPAPIVQVRLLYGY